MEERTVASTTVLDLEARMKQLRAGAGENSRVAVILEWTEWGRKDRAEGYAADVSPSVARPSRREYSRWGRSFVAKEEKTFGYVLPAWKGTINKKCSWLLAPPIREIQSVLI